MILTDSEYVQVSFALCEILIQPWRRVCRRRGVLVSTRCSELTLVCLSNSWQTRCQQPNTEAYIGPRMQFMFALLERAVQGRAVVFEEEIWTLYVLASKCRTCHRQRQRLTRYYDEVLATKMKADSRQQFWYLYSKPNRINFVSSSLKKKLKSHFQTHLQQKKSLSAY